MRFPFTISPVDRIWAKNLIRKPTMLHWYSHWKKSFKETQSPLQERLPWITYEAIDWLQSYLQPEMHVFEWGSGGSTMFFAPQVHSVISVEHDPEWYAAVMQSLHNAAIDNVQMFLHSPIPTPHLNPQFGSTLEQFKGFSYETYVKAIDDYPDSYFDLVMVDGRARVCCVERAVDKVRSGGYLLLDNTEREDYLPAATYMHQWQASMFTGPVPNLKSYVAQCTLWQKPK